MSQSKTYFVSDLHLFAKRSNADNYLATMERLVRQADSFVLGGDIFDFRWSTLSSLEATLDAAEQWLRELVDCAPACQFHMLLGNHDHHEGLIERLSHLDQRHHNLSWEPYYVRLGQSLFLHGDAVDGRSTHADLAAARSRQPHHNRRGPAANWLYDAVIQTGVHRTIPVLAYPKLRTAKRLLNYMNDIGQDLNSGVRNVYFGHTHRAIDGYQFGGVTFHNGGAPIKGVAFQILTADVTEES